MTTRKNRRKKTVIGWIGKKWYSKFRLAKTTGDNLDSEIIPTRFRQEIDDVHIELTVEELP